MVFIYIGLHFRECKRYDIKGYDKVIVVIVIKASSTYVCHIWSWENCCILHLSS